MVPQLYCRQANWHDAAFAYCRAHIKFVNEVYFESQAIGDDINLAMLDNQAITVLRVIWSSRTGN